MAPRILILGGGGREHALAWRLARDPERPEVVVAPGNCGIGLDFRCVDVPIDDVFEVVTLARRERPALVVIGPEAALAAAVSDALAAAGFVVFGPSRAAAAIETSKWFAKEIMAAAGVATPRSRGFTDREAALAALDSLPSPWVVKVDGLAAGKGVCVTSSRAEARAFAEDCLRRGKAGTARVLVEEYVSGDEASVIAVCDGERFLLLPPARDFKRAFDRDTGPNTGGMGSLAPVPDVTPALEERIAAEVFAPVLATLAARGTPFRGALYAGLMLTVEGPRVIEFNARFGDPETQSLVPLLGGSLGSLLLSAAGGRLDPDTVERRPLAAATLALVDESYPAGARGGFIRGLDPLRVERDRETPRLLVFQAAGQREGSDWRFHGGRIAYLTAVGRDLRAAREQLGEARGTLSGAGWRSRDDVVFGSAITGETT